MFSSLSYSPRLIFDSKTEKQTVGEVQSFPGGQYYAEQYDGGIRIFDTEDKLVCDRSGEGVVFTSVSSNQFIYDSQEAIEKELITILAEDGVCEETINYTTQICRIFDNVRVNQTRTGFRLLFEDGKTKSISTFEFHGVIMNNISAGFDSLAFIDTYQDNLLWVYDGLKRDLVPITRFPNARVDEFEYYPEVHALITQEDNTYKTWDSRFPRNPVYIVNTYTGVLFGIHPFVFNKAATTTISYMHYLYPEQVHELCLPEVTQLCYNGYSHSLDCYGARHRYRYKIV